MKRMADLEEQVIEKERLLKALQDDEAKKLLEFNTLKTNTEKLKGEREYL